jgi:TPR repeat protein
VFLLYVTFCFYNGISNHLFVQLFLCVVILLTVYWVDIYRLTTLFGRYFLALNALGNNNFTKAYHHFDQLIQKEFAPSLRYLSIMKFMGLGTNSSTEAAIYYSERAIRNGYLECHYTLAVCYFFGDSLSKKCSTNLGKLSKTNTHTKSEIKPNYNECVFNLIKFLNEHDKKHYYYREALAMLGYCLNTGKGIPKNQQIGNNYLKQASQLGSKNISTFKKCLNSQKEVTNFILDFK